jgi:arabinogalactan endo-1,4-beta-galactosidase
MKRTESKLQKALTATAFAALALPALMFISCEVPTYPTSEAEANTARTTFTSYDSVTVNSIDATVSDDFMRGFDASTVYAIEKNGGRYYNESGEEEDIFSILADHGVNWIRLRIWNNPDETDASTQGWNDLAVTKALAVRAKKAGMKVLLDFHYSDTWADPNSQVMPTAWASLSTIDEVANAVYSYTYDTLITLKDAGASPDMVQLGNEMEGGLFTTGGIVKATYNDTYKANLLEVLQYASRAVRLADADAIVALHFSRGGDTSKYSSLLSYLIKSSLDFDAVGLSYYPIYSSHKTLTDITNAMATIKTTYGKKAFISEVSYGWTPAWGDSTNNIFYCDDEETAYTELIDGSHDSEFVVSAAGTETFTADSSSQSYVHSSSYIGATPQNQANVVRAVIQATAESGGLGVFYWGGDWIPCDGITDAYENQALFDFQGKCLPSMNVFKVSGQ